MQTSLHINFDGQCEEAFHYYERTLGGKLEFLLRYESAPGDHGGPVGWEKKVLHAALRVGGQTLMGCDAPPSHYEQAKGFSVALHFKDEDEAEHAFEALGNRGQVRMPMQETFWAKRFGM